MEKKENTTPVAKGASAIGGKTAEQAAKNVKEAVKNDKNGQNRCPACGATDVKLNPKTGLLVCQFCRTEFKGQNANAKGGVEELKGRTVGSGAGDVIPDEKVILTFKCPSCGAEVVINANEATSARCHWCRHIFSLNEKMPNGAVPDLVLPFQMEKNEAEAKIREFVKKRQFFAHPQFKKEFTTENIMGVYLPYMVVDANIHIKMQGEAEHLVRKYSRGSGNNRRTYYDADAYAVGREFDLLVDDLTIEASSDKLNQDLRANTNNVINSIMPFDTENCVDWNPGFLIGYASQRRDTNVEHLAEQVKLQVCDIARFQMNEDMKQFYDRGERWDSEETAVTGSKWKSAYLPVWLYSYQQKNKNLLHYVAVNARTGETMGSVPINKSLLFAISAIIEIISVFIGGFITINVLAAASDDDEIGGIFVLFALSCTPGFIFYWLKLRRYRNMDKRHTYEKETDSKVENLQKRDDLREHRKGLRNARINGENGCAIRGVVAGNGKNPIGEKMAKWVGVDADEIFQGKKK